jgi:hypothetical protein
MDNWVDLLQWPAMLASVSAAWLVASPLKRRRHLGFWVFMASNALWIAWGWPRQAWALVILQLLLGLMNLRGLRKSDPEPGPDKPATDS